MAEDIMLDLSIIVPVYNAEKYLRECIESLNAQSVNAYEIILVNDGSNDKSESIIDEYCMLNKRCKKITQTNQGVSAARNRGIEKAVGNYIGFVDADDYIDADYFNKLVEPAIALDLDIVFTDLVELNGNRRINHELMFEPEVEFDREFMSESVPNHMSQTNDFNNVFTKIFRKDMIMDNAVIFDTNKKLGEDGDFCLEAFKVANSGLYIKNAGYYYRDADGSATRKSDISIYVDEILNNYTQRTKNIDLVQEDVLIKSYNEIFHLINYIFDNESYDIKLKYTNSKLLLNNSDIGMILNEYRKLNITNNSRFARYMKRQIIRKSFVGVYLLKTYSKLREGRTNE